MNAVEFLRAVDKKVRDDPLSDSGQASFYFLAYQSLRNGMPLMLMDEGVWDWRSVRPTDAVAFANLLRKGKPPTDTPRA